MKETKYIATCNKPAWVKRAVRNNRARARYRAKRDGITVDEADELNRMDLMHRMMDLTDLDDVCTGDNG